MQYIRTCQSCGHEQICPEPTFNNKKDSDGLTTAFRERKCYKCKSESLDFGSLQPSTPAEIAKALKELEEEL